MESAIAEPADHLKPRIGMAQCRLRGEMSILESFHIKPEFLDFSDGRVFACAFSTSSPFLF